MKLTGIEGMTVEYKVEGISEIVGKMMEPMFKKAYEAFLELEVPMVLTLRNKWLMDEAINKRFDNDADAKKDMAELLLMGIHRVAEELNDHGPFCSIFDYKINDYGKLQLEFWGSKKLERAKVIFSTEFA